MIGLAEMGKYAAIFGLLAVLSVIAIVMMARDDCQKPGTVSFELNQTFKLGGCK